MQDLFGKVVSLVVGAAFVILFGSLGLEALRDYRAFDDAPTPSTLLAAIEASTGGRRWVSVEGAPWRCRELLLNVAGGVAFLPASADDGSTAVARFDQSIRCDAVVARPLVGIVEPMSAERAADLRAAGLPLPAGARLRTLDVCTSCGKDNARLGVVICSLLVLVGLFFYPLRQAFQSWRGRMHASFQNAIHAPPAQAAEADRKLRLRGAFLVAAGVLAIALGKDWVIYGIVPVRGAGGVILPLGAWLAFFPASYRRVIARRNTG